MNSKHLPNLVKSACYVELLGGELISINSNFFIATLLQKIKQIKAKSGTGICKKFDILMEES